VNFTLVIIHVVIVIARMP